MPAQFLVTTIAGDTSPGSLGDAINQANAATGPDEIVFDTAGLFSVPQTIALSATLPQITDDLTITGDGETQLTVSGAGAYQVFNSTAANLTMTGFTVSGGLNATTSGGGLEANTTGLVTLDHMVFSGNQATYPGGSFTTGGGGAIALDGGAGFLLVRNSTISGNSATNNGGGIFFTYGTSSLEVENSTISGNSTSYAFNYFGGGGIFLAGNPSAGPPSGFTPSTVVVRNSTIAGNTATGGSGGGICANSFKGTLLIQDSTISGNTATGGASPKTGGGGICLYYFLPTLTIENSVVSGNTDAAYGPDIVAPGATNAYFSAIGDTTGIVNPNLDAASSALVGANLMLGTLQNNGGTTDTVLPAAGSPLINGGSNALIPSGLTTDQRGEVRAFGTVDIGSVEVQPAGLPLATGAGPTVTATGATSYTFTVTYSDPNGTNNGILASSVIGNNLAVRVTGPNGFDVPATFVSIDNATNGTPRTATYKITPPAGSWHGTDTGVYSINVQPSQVFDLDANPVQPGTVGTFVVDISQTFVVTNANDAGPGSLRDAVTLADSFLADDTITFDPTFFNTSRTITLATALPTITGPGGGLTIVGPGSANLKVDGAGAVRVLDSQAPTLNLSKFTVTGGLIDDSTGGGTGEFGGGLRASGIVTLDHMVFTGNTATSPNSYYYDAGAGGGIGMNPGGFLIVRNSTIANNVADQKGAGIYFRQGGGLVVVNSTISGNTITPSATGTFYQGWGGGAVFFKSAPSATPPAGFTANTVVIQNSTIANNTSPGTGGGFEAFNWISGSLLVQDSTITGNAASATTGATHGGGGIGTSFGTFPVTLQNSIVSGNTAVSGPDIQTSSVNASFSAIGSTTGITTPTLDAASTALVGANLMLGTLQDNGGPTFTIAPQAGSPLLNGGSNALIPAGLITDQRGVSRIFPAAGTVDIGSVEVQPAIPTVTVPPTQPNPTNSPASIVFNVTFDQPVTGFDVSQIDFTGSTSTGMVAAISGSGTNYTVTVTGATGDGTVVVSVLAGSGTFGLNTTGQNNVASVVSGIVTIDTDAPAVTINQDPAQNDPTNSPSIVFDVQFGEAVTGFTAAGVSLAGSTAGGTLVASVSPGIPPNSFIVTVTGMTSPGTVVASVTAGAAHDPAGNASAASTSTDNSVDFDNVPPTVTITPNPAGTVGGTTVTFDVVFDEAVVGFDASKVDLSGTTAPGATVAVSGAGPAYTVTISGMTAGGTITAQIDAGVVSDPAGNLNLASGPASITYVHSGTIQFSAPTYSVNEKGAPTLTVTATRVGGTEGALSVTDGATNGTAILGTDYGAPSGTTLSWVAGDATPQTFTIPILDDGVLDGDKAFTVTLSGSSLQGALGSPATATVTILETAGLSFSAANYNVNESDGTATITVKRLFDSTGAVSVHYATSDGTATQPSDYTTAAGTLNWADGDMTDKTFTVPLIDDSLSEGNEKFNVTLSAATGNADLGPQITSTVTIGKSHGTTINGTDKKPQSTFTDADGDLVTVKLSGKVGTLTYYLTDGKGPISEIDLVGTDSSKSSVSITVTKPKGGTGDGRVQIDEIDGTGVKSLSLAKADLVGAGINLSSFLGSLTIGAISNGADITLAGAPPKPTGTTKITAGVIGDGTDIAITGAPLGSLTATSVGVGTITAPSVGSINIKGKAKTKTTPAISGDFKSNVTIAGTGLPTKPKTPALKSLHVAGSVSGSTIIVGVGAAAGTIGDVGSVSVGSFVNSVLLAGYSGPTTGTGTFNLPSTVGTFSVKGKATAFSHSFVIASNFKTVSLASVDPANGGTKFGFVYHTSLKSLSVKTPSFKFVVGGPAEQDMPSSDFYVKKV